MPVPAAPTGLTLIPVGGTVTVSTGYNSSATSIVLNAGEGATLPPGSYLLDWWNSTDYSVPTDDPLHEYVRLDSLSTDTMTVTRGLGGTSAQNHNTVGKTYKMSVLTYKGLASTCAHLQFTDNATDEDGYKVERKIGAGSFVEVAQLAANIGGTVVNYLDRTGTDNGGTTLRGALVTFRVRAFNGSGDSAYSNEDSLILSSNGIPAAPTSVSATWTTTGVNVTWSHASVGAWVEGRFDNTIFQVWRSTSSSGPFEEIGGAQNNGSYLDRQWAFGTTYYYKVRGWHFNGVGEFSAISASVTTAAATTPVATITANTTAYVGEPIKFSGSSSTYVTDLDRWTGTAIQYPYVWDFGAGEDTNYYKRETVYAFRTPGVKTVTLTVYNPAGTSDSETHNVTVSDIPVSAAASHSCTAGESGGSVSAVHRPTDFATLQAAITASLVQDDPLIELTTGATDYVSGAGASLLLKSQRTGARYCTIRPINYSSNFTNQKRESSSATNHAKINLTASLSSDIVVAVESHATTPAHHYRLQGIQLKKTTATESTAIQAGLWLKGSTGHPLPHHIIVQHLYIDGDPQTNHQRFGILTDADDLSVLDSHIVNLKYNGLEAMALHGGGSNGRHVIDNNQIYAFSMAIFYTGETSGLGPNGWTRHVTIRRNYLTRRAADESNSYFTSGAFNWKNLFEMKRGEFFTLNGNMFGPTWNGAQQGSGVQIKAVNQTWDTNYSSSLHVQISNNIFRDLKTPAGGAAFDIQSRDAEVSGNTDLTTRITMVNNLVFSQPSVTVQYWPTMFAVVSGEPSTRLTFSHNTMLNTDNSLSFNEADWTGTTNMKSYSIFANNLWETGYVKAMEGGAFGKDALDTILKTYTYAGNVIEGGVGGHSSWTGLDASNKFPADVATISFTDYTNRDLRLSGSSPYRAAGADPATDGTDRGANLTTIYNQLGGSGYTFATGTTKAESGDWVSGIVPPTAALTLTTFAPTVTASGPLIPANATLTTTMFAPNVSVSGSRAPVIVGRTSIVGRGSIL